MAEAKGSTKATGKKAGTKKDAEPKVNKREEARKRKEEEAAKVRQQKIDAGDLIVTKDYEFEKSSRSTKSLERAGKILATLKKSKTPVRVQALIDDLGSFYEDVLPALTMLESQDLVVRFEAKSLKKDDKTRGRRTVAYLHVDHIG